MKVKKKVLKSARLLYVIFVGLTAFNALADSNSGLVKEVDRISVQMRLPGKLVGLDKPQSAGQTIQSKMSAIDRFFGDKSIPETEVYKARYLISQPKYEIEYSCKVTIVTDQKTGKKNLTVEACGDKAKGSKNSVVYSGDWK